MSTLAFGLSMLPEKPPKHFPSWIYCTRRSNQPNISQSISVAPSINMVISWPSFVVHYTVTKRTRKLPRQTGRLPKEKTPVAEEHSWAHGHAYAPADNTQHRMLVLYSFCQNACNTRKVASETPKSMYINL